MAIVGKSKLGSHRPFLCILGIIAWVVTAASTVFAVLDAASLFIAKVSFRIVAIVAASLAVASLCCLGLFLMQYVWKRDRIKPQSWYRQHSFAVACILPSAASIVVLLATLVLIKINFNEVARARTGSWTGQLAAKFAIWALAAVSQVTFYSSALISNQPSQESRRAIRAAEPGDGMISEVRETTPPTSLQILTPAYTQKSSLGSLPSPTFSTTSSQSLKSWRESLQQVVRPVTSRTRLIGRHSYARESKSSHSDVQSIDLASQPDGFDTWDTSSVDSQARDTIMQSAPCRGTILETIPGSRPPSPAHALDGPFPLPASGRNSPALSLPPKIYADSSRPPSPALSEAHIHPLFRTDSPTPPPAATPGTVVTASPLSGQVITCPARPYSRMRSNSRTASPSPLINSQGFHGSSSRTPSPPSREMTPPIPDFILTSSPRSSYGGGHAPRKISLHSDAGR
ncbi:hypothetical protein AOQ84DRAFT_22589 [Glonium stellatum]|uniref:Uncharacterized protein n=1 Tax=Glonium stellatum TaxID=574774 RepID=A0A8E2FCB9_9PEZI|nr:hypothetical protein AOQ84DRAFT_22589 [Glonium stellatum]